MRYCLILCFVISFSCFSQSSFEDSIINPLLEKQLLFEKVFIHTNKTYYSFEDTIWFKAYVVNHANKSSKRTTTLYVNLIDKNGTLVKTKTVFINKGVGKGQFILDEDFETGDYYIQAYTNYMRNFGEYNYFVKKIKIIGRNIDNSIVKGETNNQSSLIELFPEGGYLLEGVINNIAIKVPFDSFTAEILDSKKRKVSVFNYMHAGKSSASFFYKPNEIYFLKIITDKSTLFKPIPKAKQKGLAVSLLKANEDSLIVNLKTNAKTLRKKLDGYILLFHQKNKLINYASVYLKEKEFNFKMPYSSFFEGVNTVTVFKNTQPILQRHFFVENSSENKVEVKKIAVIRDSVQYKLSVKNLNQDSHSAQISLSVLSVDNPAHLKQQQNIKSAFLLMPYLNDKIEASNYLFNKSSENWESNIDLLLKTQKLNIDNKEKFINVLNPKYNFDFEIGITLKGKVSPSYSNTLALISKKNQLIDKSYLNNTNKFKFSKLFLFKGDSLKFSFLLRDNKTIKPKFIKVDSFKHKAPKFQLPSSFILENQQEIVNNGVDFSLYKNGYTLLEEVNLKGKAKSKHFLEKKRLVKKYKRITFDIGLYMPLKVSEFQKQTYSLMNYLNHEGVFLKDWKGVEYYLSVGVNKEAILYVDGVKQVHQDLVSLNIDMSDIENIFMQPIKKGNRLYQVFTKDSYRKNIENLFQLYVLNYGYDMPNDYITPLQFDNRLLVNDLDWKPYLNTNKKGDTYFMLAKDKDINNKVFDIQGVFSSGKLINKQIE